MHNKILFSISQPAIYEAIYLIPILIVRQFIGNKEKLGMFIVYGWKFLSTYSVLVFLRMAWLMWYQIPKLGLLPYKITAHASISCQVGDIYLDILQY